MKSLAGLTAVQGLSWSDVFEIWQQTEEGRPEWEEHYQAHGYKSWEEWRTTNIAPLKPEMRQWQLFSVNNPLNQIPRWYGGPHQSWIEKYYANAQQRTFAWLLEHTDIANRAADQNDKIGRLAKNFPESTTLIGCTTDNKIIVLEGMHRCCAIAAHAQQKQDLHSTIQVALANIPTTELVTIGSKRA